MSPELAKAIRTRAGAITAAILFLAVLIPFLWISFGREYAGYAVAAGLLVAILLWVGVPRAWALLIALAAVVGFAERDSLSHFGTTRPTEVRTSTAVASPPPLSPMRPCDGTYDCRSALRFVSNETAPLDKPERSALVCMPPDQQWSRKYSVHLWSKDGAEYRSLGTFPLSIQSPDGRQVANAMPEYDRIAFVADSGAAPVEAWFVRAGHSCLLP